MTTDRPIINSAVMVEPGDMRRLRDVLRLLAQPFAGREGWREEWADTPSN